MAWADVARLACSRSHAAKNAGIWGRQHGCLQQEQGLQRRDVRSFAPVSRVFLIFLENDKKGQTSHRDN
jgi:hypothetical protein